MHDFFEETSLPSVLNRFVYLDVTDGPSEAADNWEVEIFAKPENFLLLFAQLYDLPLFTLTFLVEILEIKFASLL